MSSVYYTVFISESGGFVLGWLFTLLIVYLMWRGLKLAWGLSVAWVAIGVFVSVGEALTARAPGGHAPVLHLIEAALLLAMLVLLLLPETRRFYASRTR